MATHGEARENTIRALRTLTPFNRNGFNMTGIEGKVDVMGRLNPEHIARYNADDVIYTVKSYATPIAWVTRGGLVRVPEQSYSNTTTHHQSLCRVYLNQ